MYESMYFSPSERLKYKVSKSHAGYTVEALRKKRVPVYHPDLGHTYYTYAFRLERTFPLTLPSLKCDPSLCAQSYFLGHCVHEQIVHVLHAAWQAERDQYLQHMIARLEFLASRLRDLCEQLLTLFRLLKQVPYARLVRDKYVLMTPDFLAGFPLQDVLTILRAIRFPLEDYQGQDAQTIIRRACQFNLTAFRVSLN